MNINQKINAKANAIILYGRAPKKLMERNYKQPYQGVYSPGILLPKQFFPKNYKECGDLTKSAINY